MSASTPATVFLDVSGRLPPEPMEQILEALATLAPDRALQVLIDREPFPCTGCSSATGIATG